VLVFTNVPFVELDWTVIEWLQVAWFVRSNSGDSGL
jgi:hypothetical protein